MPAGTSYLCRWDHCARSFPSLPALRSHFVHEHIPAETAVYVPTHKRRRRESGGWELEAPTASSPSVPLIPVTRATHMMQLDPHTHLPGLMPAVLEVGVGGIDMMGMGVGVGVGVGVGAVTVDMSPMTTLSSIEPSFAVPSLPPPFTYSQSVASDPDHEPEPINFGAFLRSPSPDRQGPVQSAPLSQVPPESQPHSSQANTSASSAALVSPARGSFMTQAIPPLSAPSTSTPSATPNSPRSFTGPPGSPATGMQIAFGTARSGAVAPGRKLSASGFTWGMSKGDK